MASQPSFRAVAHVRRPRLSDTITDQIEDLIATGKLKPGDRMPAERDLAQQLDVSRGVNCSVTYEALGVVAGIVPFNFPTMVPLWMIPQAQSAFASASPPAPSFRHSTSPPSWAPM